MIDKLNWNNIKTFKLKRSIKNLKGVYVIWNATLNKYYVGQSKTIGKRIFEQHFGTNINKLFYEDYMIGCNFLFSYILCNSKDLLDSVELEMIKYFHSDINGYNKTKGNK
jgi:hypothetical protein